MKDPTFVSEIQEREKRRVLNSMLEAMRHLARKKCIKSNCGTVCLCGPCHAKRALDYYEREGGWP